MLKKATAIFGMESCTQISPSFPSVDRRSTSDRSSGGGEELVGSLHPTCKTPGCINPKHLAIGRERKENNWNLPEHESAVSVFKNYTLAVKQWRGIRSKKEYSSASAKRSLKLYCLKQLGME